MKLNKLFVVLGAMAMGLVACKKKEEDPVVPPAPTEITAKFGLGYFASYYTSYGTTEGDCTAAAVVFDEQGKVVNAYLDVVQVKIQYTTNGKETSDPEFLEGVKAKDGITLRADCCFKTKLELGAAYNMIGSSAIGKEVNEQIAAYVDWTIGKTAAEITADVDANGYAADTALKAECSIKVGDFAKAYAKAYATAEEIKYTGEIKVGLGMMGQPAYNYGKPSTEISVDMAAVAVANGKTVDTVLDAVVMTPVIEDHVLATTGKTEGNKYYVNGAWASKKDIGDAYGMKGKQGCTIEWFDQIANLEDELTGIADTTGIALTSGKLTNGTEVGCTITASSYVNACAIAIADAR